MPLTTKQLREEVATIKIDLPIGELAVTYWPGRLSESEMKSAWAEKEDTAGTLCRVISGWDFLGDDGQPLPITRESLALLPMPFMKQIAEALFSGEGVDPNK